MEGQKVLTHGLVIDWLHNHHVCLLTVTSNTRDSADEWAEQVQSLAEHWSNRQMILLMHDMRGLGLTPYLRQTIIKMMGINPDIPERIAVILSADLLGKGAALFTRTLRPFINNENSQIRVFHDRANGIKWLESFLPEKID